MAQNVKKYSPEAAWAATLQELELQMTKATFNTWLKSAQLGRVDTEGGKLRFVIYVRNDYAVDWLKNRLNDSIVRTLCAILGEDATLTFQVKSEFETPPEPEMPPLETAVNGNGVNGSGGNLTDEARQKVFESTSSGYAYSDGASNRAGFTGFMPIDSNFTTCPDLFFDYVVPNAHATVTKLVASVIRQTIGTFEDKRKNRRREEWPVNNSVLMRAAGISSKTSLQVALWDARDEGYVVLREIDDLDERGKLDKKYGYQCRYALRIRYHDDDVDHPQEDRPSYGNTKKKKRQLPK